MFMHLRSLLTITALSAVTGLTACGGGGSSGTGSEEAAIGAHNTETSQDNTSGGNVNAPFSAEVAAAPEDRADISGIVRLEVRGSNMENVELLPANGYEPKHGIFNLSDDNSFAWLDLNTDKLPNGPIEVRISAFDVPAGQSGAREIIAMPARTWNIDNPPEQGSEFFAASVASAPADGATVSGIVRLEVRGNGIANAELLPATGYSPRFGVFNVSEDKTYAWLDFDTRSLPDGEREVRISAFNVTAGQPGAREIVAMPARSWNFSNGASGAFTATVTMAPVHGAFIDGTTRLEVRGSGLENVELLPAYGYEPKFGVFTISPDKTYAHLEVSTEELPEGVFYARISAFDKPAGSATAREIIAMPARQWTTPLANGTPPPGPLTDIRFENPHEIAADANGNLYVADLENNNDRIRKIDPDGSVTTVFSKEGPTITSLAVTPAGEIFYGTAGNFFHNEEGGVREIVDGKPVRITSEEMAISEFVIDPSNGHLYVGVWTPSGPEVKEIRQDGSVTTLFSIDETSGAPAVMTLHNGVLWLAWRDGPYRSRAFRWSRANGLEEIPLDLDYVSGMEATDSGIYIAGYGGSSANTSVATSCTVNLLDPDTLELTHVAGVEGEPCHYEEDAPPPGRLDLRFHVSLTQASDGNLYLTEGTRDVIRKITPEGEVSTYAGVHNQPGQ